MSLLMQHILAICSICRHVGVQSESDVMFTFEAVVMLLLVVCLRAISACS